MAATHRTPLPPSYLGPSRASLHMLPPLAPRAAGALSPAMAAAAAHLPPPDLSRAGLPPSSATETAASSPLCNGDALGDAVEVRTKSGQYCSFSCTVSNEHSGLSWPQKSTGRNGKACWLYVQEGQFSAQAEARAVYGEPFSEKAARVQAASPHGRRPGWAVRPVIVKSGDDCRQELLAAQLIRTFADIFQVTLQMRLGHLYCFHMDRTDHKGVDSARVPFPAFSRCVGLCSLLISVRGCSWKHGVFCLLCGPLTRLKDYARLTFHRRRGCHCGCGHMKCS